MTKPLSSFPKDKRARVAQRRLGQVVKGLGYWAAHDWLQSKRDENKAKKEDKPIGDVIVDKIKELIASTAT